MTVAKYECKLDSLSKRWYITNNSDVYITQTDYLFFSKFWKLALKDLVKPNHNVLVVNDPEQMFVNSIIAPCSITSIHKDVYTLCAPEYAAVLNTIPFKNVVDSLGFTRKLLLLDTDLKDAKEDGCIKTKYDVIIIHAKNKEELHYLQIEYYFKLLNDFGILVIHADNELITSDSQAVLNHYFSLLSQNQKPTFIQDKVKSVYTLQTYIKLSRLL